jgi:hypothetical protein
MRLGTELADSKRLGVTSTKATCAVAYFKRRTSSKKATSAASPARLAVARKARGLRPFSLPGP